MIIIHELKTVLILVPRTGSSSLRDAVLERYPRAIMLYRHMEADGVPYGYTHYRRIGVCRHPLERLWSLWKFLQTFGENEKHDPVIDKWPPAYVAAQRAQIEGRTFEQWVLENETVFTHPYYAGTAEFRPFFTVHHPLPENRKSQRLYLRPDLGTEVFPYALLSNLARELDVQLPFRRRTRPLARPASSPRLEEYMRHNFAWDYCAC